MVGYSVVEDSEDDDTGAVVDSVADDSELDVTGAVVDSVVNSDVVVSIVDVDADSVVDGIYSLVLLVVVVTGYEEEGGGVDWAVLLV